MTVPTTNSSQTAPLPLPTSLARHLADEYRTQSAITLRVLRAYPADRADLKPHPDSNAALQLLKTFVIENNLLEGAVKHGLREPVGWQVAADDWAGALQLYEEGVGRVQSILDGFGDADVARSVSFFKGPPKQPAEFALFDFARFMINDSIHHRGQLTVYLRLAGGKVPSIYGPSKDEPWN